MNCRKKNKKKRQRPGSIDLNTHKQPTQLRKAGSFPKEQEQQQHPMCVIHGQNQDRNQI
jgi:hypothetical protein